MSQRKIAAEVGCTSWDRSIIIEQSYG